MGLLELSQELQLRILQLVCSIDFKLVADVRQVHTSFRDICSTKAFWASQPRGCCFLLFTHNPFRALVEATVTEAVFFVRPGSQHLPDGPLPLLSCLTVSLHIKRCR